MKIISPVSNVGEVEKVINAGADEIYCGVFTQKWRERYTDIGAPNRHPSRHANLKNFDELNRVVKLAHSYNVPVCFSINEFYSGEQYDMALEEISKAIEMGIDALIISDINLLLMVRDKIHSHIKIHVGTGGTTFNSSTVSFYKNLGASRVILDRQLSISEIEQITSKSSDMEIEVFVLNQKCHNIDGFCSFQHGLIGTKYPLLSRLWNTKLLNKLLNLLPYSIKIQSAILQRDLGCCLKYEIFDVREVESYKRKDIFFFSDAEYFLSRCGACAVYDLNKSKIKFVKIVGRENLLYRKVKDIRFIRKSIDLLNDRLRKEVFIDKVKALHKQIYSSDCNSKLCYYPDGMLTT